MEKVYDGKDDIQLTGIFIKEILDMLEIPLKKTKKHGVIHTSKTSFDLYESLELYKDIQVFYGHWEYESDLIPNYFFNKDEIKEYNLTPIGEKELPTIMCEWLLKQNEEGVLSYGSLIKFKYNRKNEEKYRLRFLMDPNFDPREWEWMK